MKPNIDFDALDVPVIPSRGLPWKKVWALISLILASTGTAVGTSAWAGVEAGNKNSVVSELEKAREEKTESHIKKLLFQTKYYIGSEEGKRAQLKEVLEMLQKEYPNVRWNSKINWQPTSSKRVKSITRKRSAGLF